MTVPLADVADAVRDLEGRTLVLRTGTGDMTIMEDGGHVRITMAGIEMDFLSAYVGWYDDTIDSYIKVATPYCTIRLAPEVEDMEVVE